jgi:hypothetical protein
MVQLKSVNVVSRLLRAELWGRSRCPRRTPLSFSLLPRTPRDPTIGRISTCALAVAGIRRVVNHIHVVLMPGDSIGNVVIPSSACIRSSRSGLVPASPCSCVRPVERDHGTRRGSCGITLDHETASGTEPCIRRRFNPVHICDLIAISRTCPYIVKDGRTRI